MASDTLALQQVGQRAGLSLQQMAAYLDILPETLCPRPC